MHIGDSHMCIFLYTDRYIYTDRFRDSCHIALPRTVYTGRDKATVANHVNFVSVHHEKNEGFTLWDLLSRRIQCRQHHWL